MFELKRLSTAAVAAALACARILADLPATEPDIPEFHSLQSE